MNLLTLIAVVLVCPVIYLSAILPRSIHYENHFERPIQYAVSDTNPAKAIKRLKKSVDFLEENNLDQQDQCIWVYSPMCDSSEFYGKLQDSIALLEDLEDKDALTVSNTMIRFRESFVTSGSEGEKIGFPNNTQRTFVYGGNKYFAYVASIINNMGLLLFIIVVLGFLGIFGS